MHVEDHFREFTARDWQTTTNGEPIRIAVIGLGGFATSRAIPAMKTADLCTPALVVSGSPDRAIEVAEEIDVDRILDYDAFHDGEAVDEYDAVYIATPNATHLEYATTAARFGKHVLVEKPLETTVERATQLVNTCEEMGITLMTAYRLQLEPTVRRTRELVSDGFIGETVRLSGTFTTRLLDHVHHNSWRLDPSLSGGGALIDIGIYPLNTARYLLDADPTTVSATTASIHDAFESVDEHVSLQLEFPNGITVSCAASFNAHPNSYLHIVGTEGMIKIDAPFGGTVPHEILAERDQMCVEHTGPPVDEVLEEIEYFSHCILTDSRPEPDGYDGLTDVRVIEAAYESADSGTTVRL